MTRLPLAVVGAGLFLAGMHASRVARAQGAESAPALEARASPLLAALLLARIDGKSPVEYLTAPRDLDFVRSAARDYLAATELTLDGIRQDWETRALAR